VKRLFWITVILVLVNVLLTHVVAGVEDEASVARRFCVDFFAADDDAMANVMDAPLKAAMTPEGSQQIRESLVVALGPLEEIGEAWYTDEVQGYRRYRVPVRFENGMQDLLVAFEPGGKVGGLFTVKHIERPSLEREAKAAELPRPQTPQPPFDYRAEDVTYTSDEFVRAGTLTIPNGNGPFPAVLLLSGSGAQDRDSLLFGHRSFLLISDHLTRAGIAVLRVDDRGVGGSTGNLAESTLSDFAEDAIAGVRFLAARAEIDAKRIGLIGHSEGGIVAPLAASRSAVVGFVVILAGTGVPGAQVMDLQMQQHMRLLGVSEETIEAAAIENRKLNSLIAEGATTIAVKDQLAILKRSQGDPTAVTPAELAQLTAPWTRSFITYDPRPALAKIKVPVLALNGELDFQVNPDQNLTAIRAALKHNSDVTLHRLPKLNHLFQTAETGAFDEYSRIEETFTPVALDLIRDWILENTR